ncbi:hypothetical protein VPH35_010362 [Triticum aestivum]
MDWSSLLPELIDRIASCLLNTADLDCYMALRAVCHNWRAATADPTNTMDHRFRPHNWVMLDYPTHGQDAHLLVNTETGRYHCRSIPMLRNYYVVSVTVDGLLVLAGKAAPHASCVLNPFTGHMVRFKARLLPHVMAAAVSGSSPPYLVLYCHDSRKLYRANPGSEEFVRYKKKYGYPLVRKAVQGCVATDGHEGVLPPLPAAVGAKIADLMTPVVADLPHDGINLALWKRCFTVESAGETLVVFKLGNRVEVFMLDKDGTTLERVNSIGNRAIFIGGCHRCLSLDADKLKFPSIQLSKATAYTSRNDGEGEQCPIGAAPSANLPTFLCNPLTAHPLTITLLLSIYTFNGQSGQVSKVLEYEDRLLEQLWSGELSLEDLILRASQEGDTDSDDSI